MDEAVKALTQHPDRFSGLGFVFSPEDPYCGIDLDNCRDPQTGKIKLWASEILHAIDSYAEVSPSGTGVKIWAKATLPSAVKAHVDHNGHPVPPISGKPSPRADGAVEIYSSGRYFTVTGQHLNGEFRDVEDCQSAISALYDRLRYSSSQSSPFAGNNGPRIPEQIEPGNRHNLLMSLAASMRANGLGEIEIMYAVSGTNKARCNPPKEEKELASIVQWACSKPAGKSIRVPESMGTVQERPTEAENVKRQPLEREQPDDLEQELNLPDLYDPSQTKPNDIAQQILVSHKIIGNSGGMLWEYNGRWWEVITKDDVASHAMRLDTHAATKRARRTEVVSYVLDATRRRNIQWRQISDLEVPVWNGVVNVESCRVRPHKHSDYLEAVIPHEYDPSQRCHKWIAALERWFQGDRDAEAKMDAIQEYFGYCLLPHAKFKKALMLYGESNTGKSQVAHVLRALVGSQNTCSLSTEQMADERKRAGIVGKMLNVLTELPADAMIADGGFKQLVANDEPVAIDPKYLAPFTYVPFCKHIIATNTLPAINDHTRATYNRLLLIKFNQVIPPEERDPSLKDKLLTELPGILAWAIEGAERLIQKRGEFTEIAESEEEITEYREQQNPVFSFIAERCDRSEDPEAIMLASEFAEKFSLWSRKSYEVRRVVQMLRSAGERVAKVKVRSPYRDKTCVYGLLWKS